MKKFKIILGIIAGIAITAEITWLYIVPSIVSNQHIINFALSKLNSQNNYSIVANCIKLKTYPSMKIDISVNDIKLQNKNKNILVLEDLNSSLLLNQILKRKIILNSFSLKNSYADINGLLDIFPQQEEEKSSQNWDIDFINANIKLDYSQIVYAPTSNSNLDLCLEKVFVDNTNPSEAHLRFISNTKLTTGNEVLKFSISDRNKVFIKNNTLFVDDCIFGINKSQVHINAEIKSSNKFKINVLSTNFNLKDATSILETNLLVANGKEVLSYIKDIYGSFNFNFDITPKDIQGNVKINKSSGKLIPINNLPITMTHGYVQITPENIYLKDFDGYWGNSKSDKVTLEGTVKDYTKTCDTEIKIHTKLDDCFSKNYLSQVVGIPLTIIGDASTGVNIKSLGDKISITVMAKLDKGEDILVDGTSLTPTNYDRAVKADLHIQNNNLNIENINYFIASELKRGVKVKPVVTLKGNFDISKSIPELKDLGFEIPRPLPSEFLNVLIGQKLFKGGKFSGNLYVLNRFGHPKVKGEIYSENIRIPSQRLKLEKANLYTDRDMVHIVSNGKYKRSSFVFDGDIKNDIAFPIVIKNMDFSLDNIDLEKLLNSFTQNAQTDIATNNANENDDTVTFDFKNLIIENSSFKLKSGTYKDVKFGNIDTNLTLDKNSVLKLSSNKFDIAEGISTLKVNCDLKNEKYYIRLGVKDVNSDLLSSTLLNLPREISGKAMGLIELNSDSSMKMNGQIRFAITNGQIQKIGLVEYLMNMVSIFRNPLVMISPSTVMDIVNIPEGNFDKINGELHIKDNNVELLKIKSSSKLLSCYIVGCYNIEKSDAILRIYTKFSNKSNGALGVLRKISLNSIANRIPMGSKVETNYYASEIKNLPTLDADEKDCQIFLTTVDGDIEHNNFLSALKKIK